MGFIVEIALPSGRESTFQLSESFELASVIFIRPDERYLGMF